MVSWYCGDGSFGGARGGLPAGSHIQGAGPYVLSFLQIHSNIHTDDDKWQLRFFLSLSLVQAAWKSTIIPAGGKLWVGRRIKAKIEVVSRVESTSWACFLYTAKAP